MTTIAKAETVLVVPPDVQRKAGIKAGDRLKFSVARNTITISVVGASTYKPTKAELAGIRKGEAEVARGDYVTLTDLIHDLDGNRRKGRAKTDRKVSR
jgi:hypothetical protein